MSGEAPLCAATDMLDALELCEDALADLARLDDGTPSVSALHAARAAIAKAKLRESHICGMNREIPPLNEAIKTGDAADAAR